MRLSHSRAAESRAYILADNKLAERRLGSRDPGDRVAGLIELEFEID